MGTAVPRPPPTEDIVLTSPPAEFAAVDPLASAGGVDEDEEWFGGWCWHNG